MREDKAVFRWSFEMGMTRAGKVAVGAAAVSLPLTGALAYGHVGSAAVQPARGYPSPHLAAPYLQIDPSDIGDMTADMSASGVRDYTLAFLTPKSGCTPMWEDGNAAVGAFSSAVSSFQAKGGNVIVSFGGASGGDLAKTCKSVSSLEAAYAHVLSDYVGVRRLDFDIEGSVLTSVKANNRRNSALALLQKDVPSTQVDFTLPVDPDGLPPNEISLIKDAKAAGVSLNCVNVMTMDFGNGQHVLADAKSAAIGTERQLAAIYPKLSPARVWDMIGLTPIAGKNDDDEDFTQSDATALESFAAAKGVQLLAFWEVDAYDKPLGYAYSKIFEEITS
jgi:chitinase